MHRVTYEEWQLTSLFEVEPEYPSPEDPWPYTEVVYSVTQGDLCLRCTIQPSYRDVRVIMTHSGRSIYELNAMNLDEIQYLTDPGGECLRLTLSNRESLILRVKPNISLFHEAARTP